MTARVLDATKIRDQVFAELKDEFGHLATEGIRPGLAAVLVGEILPPTPVSKSRLPIDCGTARQSKDHVQQRSDSLWDVWDQKK
jgi:hypothetical protein